MPKQSSAQCLMDLYTCLKSLPSLKLLHRRSPHSTATLRHHGLKWHKLNTSYISKEKSVGLRPDSIRAMEQTHLNLSTFHQRLDLGISNIIEEVTMSPFAHEPHVISYSQRDIDP